jgi:hypothetical protein
MMEEKEIEAYFQDHETVKFGGNYRQIKKTKI